MRTVDLPFGARQQPPVAEEAQESAKREARHRALINVPSRTGVDTAIKSREGYGGKLVRLAAKALCATLFFLALPAFGQPVWQTSATAVGRDNATVPIPSGTVSGDLLVVGFMVEKGSAETITPPAGWTLIRRTDQSTNVGMATFYKVAGGSEPANYTFTTANGSKWAIGISRITGAHPSNPIDVHQGQVGTSGTAVTAPSVTTTVANTLVLAFYTNKKNSTYTAAVATTEHYDVPNNAEGVPSNMMASFVQASAGATGNQVATATDSESWVGQQVAIRPSIGSPPPAPLLLSPADGATVEDSTPDFDWTDVTDPDGDTVTYDLQADDSGCTFSSPEVNQTGLSASLYTPGSSLGDGTYCWRARAIDQNGNVGAWSATRNVTVDAITLGSQTRSPESAADCTSLGGPNANWSNSGNAAAGDDQQATASVDGTITDPLRCLNYRFTIPSNATILGIEVRIERRSSSTADGGSRDNSLFLVKAGASVGANRATTTTYTTSDVIETHGSASDLWGTTWTPAQINAADFGALFTATKPSGLGAAHTVSIDHIQITVYYSAPNITPGSFNGFETSTVANAITGVIRTKVAGSAFSLDVVAITSGAQNSNFSGTVTVELLGNNTLGVALDANNCPTSFTIVQTVSPNPTINLGRSTVSFAAVADSWRDVRVRVRYPTTSPTVTSCSTDNFAIRPDRFTGLAATDNDWETAGSVRTLNATKNSDSPIHKAGRPFTVSATARNAAGNTTTNYAGTATSVLSDCGNDNACLPTFGTLVIGASFVAGQLSSNAATYDNVGAFGMQLVDSTFATVDDADGSTAAEREIKSNTIIAVGRFVPNHFAVSLNTPVFGTACGSFSYIGQRFNYTTSAVITVTAQNFANGTTTNYEGPLWRITSASLTGKAYSAATGTLDTSGLPGADPVISDSGGGVGTLTFGSGTGLLFTRTTPVAPFDAEISLAINVIDADGVAYASNPARFGQASAGNGIAFSAGKSTRFGRLALRNANGSQLVPLPLQLETQYWGYTNAPTNTVLGFITNSADSCTSIANNNLAMSSFAGNLVACETAVSGGGAFSAGRRTVLLAAPGNANAGSVILTANLGATASGTTCTTVGGGTVAAAGANRAYLQGNWSGASYDQNPAARATFGVTRGAEEVIFIRENF